MMLKICSVIINFIENISCLKEEFILWTIFLTNKHFLKIVREKFVSLHFLSYLCCIERKRYIINESKTLLW